ncbi:MAG: four helix bundle protein [Patescibacteria group bacterium]|nr:four helix bundle protein [Patescibacteria group bacterium]
MIYNLKMQQANGQKEELEIRLKEFSFQVIQLIKSLPKTEGNIVFGKQIIRSSSFIGANYAEAIYGQTKQEFLHCINICRKEANETLYWLSMILKTNPNFAKNIAPLFDENKQILKIFISSVKTTRRGIENGH